MIRKKATLNDLKDFRKWLEGQEGSYDPQNPKDCLVCRYMRDRGATYVDFSGPLAFVYHTERDKNTIVQLPVSIAKIAYGLEDVHLSQVTDVEYTYEAARNRADVVIAQLRR